MKTEIVVFESSILNAELRNENDFYRLKEFKRLIEMSVKKQPESEFWSDALEFIKSKKIKDPSMYLNSK